MSAMTKGYETLTGQERFVLMIEAMARRDDVECDRLEDTCPQKLYRCDDAEFRDRMRRAYHIASTVCLNMREGMARIRMAEALRETARLHAEGPARIAEVAFLYGRAFGQWHAGQTEEIVLPDREALEAEIASDVDLKLQLNELREAVGESVERLAQGVHDAVGRMHAAELLTQWEGFGRFCDEVLGMEPLALFKAYGLQRDDLAVEVHTAYPDAESDGPEAARLAGQRGKGWTRRFK